MAATGEREEVPGFGRCGGPDGIACKHYRHGSVQTCWPCAQEVIERPPARRCPVCAHPLDDEHSSCGNWLCDGGRYFGAVHAIGLARRPGVLYDVLLRYKKQHGWATVLARLLVGWLDERTAAGEPMWDLITAMPHAHAEHGRDYTPGELILRLAHDESAEHPLDYGDPPVIRKLHETPSMTGRPAQEREHLAATELYPALQVPDPSRVAGRSVLVVDDFFTTGYSVNMVARRLREAGATRVDVLVFARWLRRWA